MTLMASTSPRDRFLAFAKRSIVEPWLVPSDPRALAICRVMLFYMAWPGFHATDVTPFASYADVTFRPIGILAALHVPLLPTAVLKFLGLIKAVCTGLAMIGLGFRVTAPLGVVAHVYLAWIGQSSGKINHGGLLMISVLIMMAFTRASDAWSMDALIRKLRGRPKAEPSAEYRWPRRFIALMVGSMYGAAGITKLRVTGLDWGTSDNLRLLLLSHHFTHAPPTRIGIWIADSKLFSRVLSCMALLLELSGPLAMLNRYLYALIIPSLALLQLSIWLLMGVLFREMIAIFLCLLPWDAILALGDEVARALVERWRARAGTST